MLCLLAAGACGKDASTKSDAAGRLLDQTFKATSEKLADARVDAHLRLEPEGLLAIGGPLTLGFQGPVVRSKKGHGIPRLRLAVVAGVAGQRYVGGLLADGRHAFLELDGRAYRLTDNRSEKRLGSLALHPRSWLKGESTKGHQQIAETDTIRVTGSLDVARLLDDLDGLVAAKQRTQIAAAVRSADFELWTGATDKLVRQLVLRVSFAFAKDAQPPIRGLQAGRIELRIRFDDVNAGQPAIHAPAKARPLAKAPTDRGLGGLVHCLGLGGRSGGDVAGCVTALRP